MNNIKILIFILISCISLVYIWHHKIESDNVMYYEFPGANGIIEIAIPEKSSKASISPLLSVSQITK